MKKTFRKSPKQAVLLSCFIIVCVFGFLKRDLISKKIKLNQMVKKNPAYEKIFYAEIGSTPREEVPQNRDANQVSKKYTVEVLTTRSETEAKAVIQKLAKHGVEGFYIPLQNGPEVIYRVRVGLFKSQKNAAKVASKIKKASGLKTNIKIFL